MIDTDVAQKVCSRIKELLFDSSITHYREHESFYSQTGDHYQFLIWKLQPVCWNEFSEEIRLLIETHGYKFIPGACDVSNYNPVNNTGYKVMALYKTIDD